MTDRELLEVALEALCCVDLDSLCPDYGSGHYSVPRVDGPKLKNAIIALRAALAEPVQEPCFRPMDFEGERRGWYISHPKFFLELEPDAAGQWSAFFRAKDGKEAYAEQEPVQEPVAVVALDTSQPFVAMCYEGQVTKWEQVSEHKTVVMFKDLPLNTLLYAAPHRGKS